MVLSLNAFGIPDYPYSEWILLSHRTMFSESLVIYDNNESMSSKPKDVDLWIRCIKSLAFPKTNNEPKRAKSTESPVRFNLYNGWDEDLMNSRTYDGMFSVLEKLNASYMPVLCRPSEAPFNPYSLPGAFPDIVYSSDIRSRFISSVKDTIKKIGGSDACINHEMDYYHQFPERLRSLQLLDDLVSKNPPSSLRSSGWDADRVAYPYYISLKREHDVSRAYLF
ncbi:MAG: hypothetical protein QT09_C0014G0053 [archaeon GW2011_AR18]|nr:MAG: hypothetical protein QT09_C0014G0053 [archaeon GW2011_AR18]